MNVTTDLSLLTLVTNASLLVKLVLGVLLLMSLLSWWYIFRKSFVLRDTRQRSEAFERTFWSGPDLNQLFQSITSGRRPAAIGFTKSSMMASGSWRGGAPRECGFSPAMGMTGPNASR